ncbi:M28 family peptidase [Candidatus Amarolinea dominans]|uniref:M28 family peptidase n=1 Tax=Candidatus Amarolinea dominans TaxID=3140696 RepID=UPI001D8371B6|nr:M28 family peptidase [Anaerolineae bacterium]
MCNPFRCCSCWTARISATTGSSGTPTFLIQLIQNQHYDIRQLDDLNVGELAFSSYDIERLQVLPLLYQTGYLTIKGYDPERQLYRLGYPNREIVASAAQPGLHGPRTVRKQRHHEITICVEDDMHTQLTRHLHKLSVEIGCRPVGSPANQAAAAYMRDVFSALGLVVGNRPTPAPAGSAQAPGCPLEAMPCRSRPTPFSPACDVTATVVPAATLTGLAAADLTGPGSRCCTAKLVNEPLAPKSWFLAGERDHAIIGSAGKQTTGRGAGAAPPTPQYEQFTADWELEIPAATTPVAVIERLLAQPALLHLRLDCAKYPATAANIVARKPGARPPGAPPQRMALMAHFATRFNTPGALDNAGSAAALLALAETLRGAVLPFDLEFIAFDSEEYMPIGDDEYVRRAGEASFAEVALAINMDGADYVHGPNTVARFNTSPALTARLEAIVARYPALQWTEP